MKEFMHAHASYRFVIQDEEDERPRILVGPSDGLNDITQLTFSLDLVIQAQYADCILYAIALRTSKEWMHQCCQGFIQTHRPN